MGTIEYCMQVQPIPGETVSGDITWAKQFDNRILLCLIDVAGHGKLANKLALECVTVLENHYQKDLNDIILAFNDLLKKKTRGLVLGLALINIATGLINYIGIGNIRARILGTQAYRFVSRPGVLGFSKLKPILEQYLLNNDDVFLMYSDGIMDRFEKNSFPRIHLATAESISEKVMTLFSKKTDDSSCIVLRYRYD